MEILRPVVERYSQDVQSDIKEDNDLEVRKWAVVVMKYELTI